MSWQAVVFVGLALVLVGGFVWYERSHPTARLIALVASLAALAVAGRIVLAPIPNVVATTDVVVITGLALGAAPGFAVGALAAPISNIWLGQGPWTAWQMAGWGMIGLAGALLAVVSRRRVSRIGLALACAAAGLLYGALLDFSTMVTYGGEQSLDRYLELSARALPFNFAHAAGNFAIALAAGPALVRMISRFRTRLEFSWPATEAVTLAMVVAMAVGALGFAHPEHAVAGSGSASWLRDAQGSDGGYAATPGQQSSPAMTGWVMLGLEAVQTNPLDLRTGGETPVSYLRSQVGRLRSVGDLERSILALTAAGINPRAFAGEDLVANLRAKRDGDGSVDGQVNLTAFYALAMRAAGAREASLKRSAGWLRDAQNADGGWGIQPRAPSEADSSGAALQGLVAAGVGGKAVEGGARWLQRSQQRNGGWALGSSGIVNAQSTAWAVQGLVAAGAGADAIESALRYLASLREPDGHYAYSASSDQTPIWVTAQVLLATERKAFPLASVPRAQRSSSPRSEQQASGPSAETALESDPSQPQRSGGVGGSPDRGRGNDDRPGRSANAADRQAPGANDRADSISAPAVPAAQEPVTEVTPAQHTLSAPAPSSDEDSTVIWLIVGATALAATVGGGLAWYRRRLR